MKRLIALLLSPSLAVFCFGQGSSSRPPITEISHISVYTSNAAASEHYYVHDIGLKRGADPENANGVRYYVNSNQFVEVLPLPSNTGNSRLDHLAYVTLNAEGLRAYLGAHGVAVPAK